MDQEEKTVWHESAEAAGLKYVIEGTEPCFRRRRVGKGFIFFDSKGNKIIDEKQLERFNSLVIPPAWNNVWICSTKNGHIQASGRDARGRKQYIYHPEWDIVRNATKFLKLLTFIEYLPKIREAVEADLRKISLTKNKVLAVIIRLLETTKIRVGNEEYAKSNKSYGLTTLRDKHLDHSEGLPKFLFKGKSGKEWNVEIADRRIGKIIKQCQELPGQLLFQYYDEEKKVQSIDSSDVNNYLKEITGQEFTAKDFRTFGGTMFAASEFAKLQPPLGEKEAKKNISIIVKKTAEELSNTPAICRKYYIHPILYELYTSGKLWNFYKCSEQIEGLSDDEACLYNLLKNSI